MKTRQNLALAALAVLTLVAAAPARAQDDQTVTLTVPTADLDLRTDAGVATLHHRVHVAAHKVCIEPGVIAVSEPARYADCVQLAEQGAVRKTNALIASVRTGTRYASAQPGN